MTVWSITHEAWNAMVDRVWRNRIASIRLLESGGSTHPWHITPQWNAEHKRWQARIEPGFVNGRDATIQVIMEDAPVATRARLKRSGVEMQSTNTVDARLTERPDLVLGSWRAVGADATPTGSGTSENGEVKLSFEPVPAFFAAQGVGQPPEFSLTGDMITQTQTGTFDEAAEVRLLRAVDLVLHQDRLGVSTQIRTGAGIDGTLSEMSITTARSPRHRDHPYLRLMEHYLPASSDQSDQMGGLMEDSFRDELHLATLYMVSPPGAQRGSDPDASWTPFVKHRVWWNLNHATNRMKPPLASVTLTLNTGLAGGMADPINNSLLAPVNQASNAMAALLSSERIEGRFWTV